MVLEVDPAKRRISLGLKQTLDNPWEAFARNHPVGSVVEGEVKNKTEFGLFIGLDGDVDGMVHLSDLDWNRPGEQVIEEYNKGDMVKAAGARRRRREGAHLARHQAARRAMPVGDAADFGRPAQERRRHLRGHRASRMAASRCGSSTPSIADLHPALRPVARPRRAASRALLGRPEGRRPRHQLRQEDPQGAAVSIKALEIAEEKEAVAQYGSSDSGASLGDILGAALKEKKAE